MSKPFVNIPNHLRNKSYFFLGKCFKIYEAIKIVLLN